MKRRRMLAFVLALVMVCTFSLAACGKENETPTVNPVAPGEVTASDVQYMQPQSSPNYADISADAESKYVTYYFANSGDDNNSGTSDSAPFKTVAKAN